MKNFGKNEFEREKKQKISVYLILYKMNTKENKYSCNLLSYREIFFFVCFLNKFIKGNQMKLFG